MKQEHGCDYTIACGQKLVVLKATDQESAKKESIKVIDYHDGFSDSETISSAKIYEVIDEIDINIKDIIEQRNVEAREIEAKRKEAKEMREYERLKNKFE